MAPSEVLNIIHCVVNELKARGYTTYNEYPGCVHVENKYDSTGFWTSDQNATWTVDLNTSAGDNLRSWNTGVPNTCDDPSHIADCVEVILKNFGQYSRPRSWTKEAVVARMKAEILFDLTNGVVPRTAVENFADLHDFVDANEYGGLCEPDCPFDPSNDEHCAIVNAAQEEIDQWLRNRK